jgi:methylmalonyl-CoA mutase N-terminal domain/subunit
VRKPGCTSYPQQSCGPKPSYGPESLTCPSALRTLMRTFAKRRRPSGLSKRRVRRAMETGYQRGRIQDESMHYEMLKHTGELPIIGVNTFRNPHGDPVNDKLELARSTDEEKQNQLKRLAEFHALHAKESPAMLKRLQQAVIENSNVFEVLMDAVRVCSLGQITNALFEVGGQYRRNM